MGEGMSTNDGGPAVTVAREPVGKPVIPRGALTIPARLPADAAKVSFATTSLAPGFHLVYNDVDVLSVNGDRVNVFVGPHDVVTWEPLL